MTYFNGPLDPNDYEDEYSEESTTRSKSARIKIALLLAFVSIIGTTFAANISLNGGQRKEFGQGIYQIKACDQWVGIGATAGAGAENIYVKNLKLYGFDPRLCIGRIFRIKLFPSGSTTALPLYVDETSTAGVSGDTTSVLSLMDTSTAFTGTYPTYPLMDAYQSWSADAVTMVNRLGTNVGWKSNWLSIVYTKETGVYTIVFKYPAALVAQVSSVTIESSCYSPGNCR
jgi:hypothetical protein